MSRINDCNQATQDGRFKKAQQFIAAAELVEDFAEGVLADVEAAYVTLVVHAGIAASDVICCVRLGRYSTSENHNDATAMLKQVDGKLSADLAVLLSLKTRAAYSAQSVTADALTKAVRAAQRLVAAASESRASR